jgi:ACS family glucarate transporter-like MFS transporter
VSRGATSRVRWFLIAWLFVLSAVAFLDRVNLSVAGSSLASEYRLTDVQLGFLSTVFLLGYALFQTPSGWLSDRFGPRRVLSAGVLWWGVFTALTAAVPVAAARPILFLIAIRFLLGAGEAVMYPASNQFVARWIPTQERGIANGWIFAGVGAGSGLSPSLISYIMLHHGWRSSFWLCAGIGLAAGAVWYVAARDTPDQHPQVSADELATIRAGLTFKNAQPNGETKLAPSERKLRTIVPWKTILSGRNLWAVTLSYFCYGYAAWIFFSWFYIYLARVRGLNLKASAFYGTLPFLAMAACCPLGGLLSDWLTRRAGRRNGRCGVAFLGLGLAAVFLAFGSNVHSARRWGGGAVSFPKLLLGGQRRYRRRIFRIGVWIHEHGRATGRSPHRLFDTRDRAAIWMDRIFLGGSVSVCPGGSRLAFGRSRAFPGSGGVRRLTILAVEIN